MVTTALLPYLYLQVELSLKKHLLSSDDYITKARSLKREADPMEANVEKIKKYLSAVIQVPAETPKNTNSKYK